MPRDKTPTSAAPRKRAPRKTLSIVKAEPVIATFVDPERRTEMIAEAAYYRAQTRGFMPGHEIEDWLAAEAEVDAAMLRQASPPSV